MDEARHDGIAAHRFDEIGEANYRKALALAEPRYAHHTTPADAGRIFAEARPKLAVYTHIVLLSNKDNPELTIGRCGPRDPQDI